MPDSSLNIDTESYAGYKGEEMPRRFRLEARTVEVAATLDRWMTPEYRYFRVIGDDGHTYVLRCGVTDSRWELTETMPGA